MISLPIVPDKWLARNNIVSVRDEVVIGPIADLVPLRSRSHGALAGIRHEYGNGIARGKTSCPGRRQAPRRCCPQQFSQGFLAQLSTLARATLVSCKRFIVTHENEMLKVLLTVDGSKSAVSATHKLVKILSWHKEQPQVDLLSVHSCPSQAQPYWYRVGDALQSVSREAPQWIKLT